MTAAERRESFAPGRLWSLWELMDRFPTSVLFDVCRIAAQQDSKWAGDQTILHDESRKKQAQMLQTYIDGLHPLGLSASCATLKKMKEKYEAAGTRRCDIGALAGELLGRLIDETGDKTFFSLLPKEAEYFNNHSRGWEIAIARFKISDDVEEASKCFALSRYAAAVFHSLQIIEVGLIELGIFIKVADPKSGWTAVSKALNTIVQKPHPKRTRFEKKNFVFLEQMQGTVEGLKNAWRNKISHAQGRLTLMTTDFSPEIAEEILFATRAFIRRLAEGVPPDGKRASGARSS